jgi:hypothetical protein
MRHLVRGLILAAVLVAALPHSQRAEAYPLVCIEGGICSSTCEFCFSNTDCPNVGGFRQSCVCGGICP